MANVSLGNYDNLFEKLKQGIASLDPIAFIEKYLTLDGHPFRLHGNGYKMYCDIYRYIGTKALDPNAKPIIMVKGRQVGGTIMCAALELYFMTCGIFGAHGKPPMRLLHCFPQLDMAKRYGKTKLNPMILASNGIEDPKKPGKKIPFVVTKLDVTTDTSDSMSYKQFEGGNFVAIESAGLTGDRIRGFTADGIFFDEVQDIRAVALSSALKILSQAQYGNKGLQVYFGTPKKKGSAYWKMWQASSQGYYHLGCEQCGKTFPLYTPGNNDWKKIWIEDDLSDDHKNSRGIPDHGFIVRCVHCGFEQDKRDAVERGKWIFSKPEEQCTHIGYHINQLYMPNMSRADIIAQEPEFHPINNERIYQNEVLGEFYSGDSSPLTTEDIDDNCADRDRRFAERITPSDHKRVYLGCDWGDKIDINQVSEEEEESSKGVGKSYSSVVVLSVEGPQLLNIQYANILPKKTFEYKKQVVQQLYQRYSVNLGIGDIGHAGDLSEELQKEYGKRFLTSRAVNTLNGKIRLVDEHIPHSGEIQFERDYHIDELINAIKKGRIRFPYKPYEMISWLVQHCCSMELKPKVDQFGDVKTTYVKGNTPNDGFMALLNAWIAYKYDITNGFKIKDPNRFYENPTEMKVPPVLLAHMPGMNVMKRNQYSP